ncbi:capsular biosynthesis protein [uncultured Sphingomonas sp.]|uniref:capsule biosynthesis protein n=1 Tax=uncultured Sphingomonas sp. TaxID=158754 RepID=UPI0025D00347|nr:capsular biosynthesis protein [uncultured Sphingomonas sp.]
MSPVPQRRSFVFLQGPPGPLLQRLAVVLRSRGITVHRINICAGDRVNWQEPATDFQGRSSDWPMFFDAFLRRHQITDVLLFGDCRPYHVTARGIATLRGIRTHVLEEGYLRPHWMTLELEGVNAHSRLRRDKEWFLEQARQLPEEPELPPVTAHFRRRVRDSAWYYTALYLGSPWTFPHYRTHRTASALSEAVGWSWKYLVRGWREGQTRRTLERMGGKRFFLLPLQLSGDYQIRSHSPFPDVPVATAFVLDSFASHAPSGTHLLIKAHPLDCSFFPWSRFISRRAWKLGIADRVHYIDGGNLEDLAAAATGMVCVNSTSATLALQANRPVCVLGEAIYKIAGLTFEGHLDDFWIDPSPPEPGLYAAFRRVLVDRCLVRGGLASESAVTTLVENMANKLCGAVPFYCCSSQSLTMAK